MADHATGVAPVQTTSQSPRLGEPGAGLPFYEWALAKYIIFPYRFLTVSKDQAISDFAEESKKILQIAGTLSKEEFCEKRLVRRQRGMEDNSRFWSVAMAVEHLIIAGTSIRSVLIALSKGETNLPPGSIKNMKPNPDVAPTDLLTRFEQMTEKFTRTASTAKLEAFPDATYTHPWFGPLTAKQWLVFAAPHQKVHRAQIEEIVRILKAE